MKLSQRSKHITNESLVLNDLGHFGIAVDQPIVDQGTCSTVAIHSNDASIYVYVKHANPIDIVSRIMVNGDYYVAILVNRYNELAKYVVYLNVDPHVYRINQYVIKNNDGVESAHMVVEEHVCLNNGDKVHYASRTFRIAEIDGIIKYDHIVLKQGATVLYDGFGRIIYPITFAKKKTNHLVKAYMAFDLYDSKINQTISLESVVDLQIDYQVHTSKLIGSQRYQQKKTIDHLKWRDTITNYGGPVMPIITQEKQKSSFVESLDGLFTQRPKQYRYLFKLSENQKLGYAYSLGDDSGYRMTMYSHPRKGWFSTYIDYDYESTWLTSQSPIRVTYFIDGNRYSY